MKNGTGTVAIITANSSQVIQRGVVAAATT